MRAAGRLSGRSTCTYLSCSLFTFHMDYSVQIETAHTFMFDLFSLLTIQKMNIDRLSNEEKELVELDASLVPMRLQQ